MTRKQFASLLGETLAYTEQGMNFSLKHFKVEEKELIRLIHEAATQSPLTLGDIKDSLYAFVHECNELNIDYKFMNLNEFIILIQQLAIFGINGKVAGEKLAQYFLVEQIIVSPNPKRRRQSN